MRHRQENDMVPGYTYTIRRPNKTVQFVVNLREYAAYRTRPNECNIGIIRWLLHYFIGC